MGALLHVIWIALDWYKIIVFAAVIFSWLYAFGVVNSGNQFVAAIGNLLHQLTEPLLRPIRNMMPRMGTLDLAPIVLLLAIILVQEIIVRYLAPNVI